jgi:hypothetical protein
MPEDGALATFREAKGGLYVFTIYRFGCGKVAVSIWLGRLRLYCGFKITRKKRRRDQGIGFSRFTIL